MFPLFDAHCHFQDDRLARRRARMVAGEKPLPDLAAAVVNGTRETDWVEVAELAHAWPWVVPSFGLHPWHVRERGEEWLAVLRGWLEKFPSAAVGEVGLDRWMDKPDVAAQAACFEAQWRLAVERDRALTVHCVRAFGWLEELTRDWRPPGRGWLLHSYGGPVEMVPMWVRRGAYFSISPYFAHERKARQLEVFRAVPVERLLIETDAPDMWPPPGVGADLQDARGDEINDPANLVVSLRLAQEVTGCGEEELRAQLAENFARLFGGGFCRL